ncbi:ABC transporter substrate-binding protein [Nocardia mangyaensis]|uniref:ABC transporter substrate-binding protein n=1 Tax=Nocardia mangyaensis TaxID=2213200 RepID=A0A1J0VZ61_9NOCA|nr:ABC transporter permease [Nocardia mangyaensis]APE37285.1 ABC transporter substrate-binding protein [Nocardia mangyaensis]
MFVALRDLRAARGRFLLITTVVLLVAVLVSFLSGLTAGLAHQNISAVEGIDADEIVFAETGTDPSFDSSVLTEQQLDQWTSAAENATVTPIGISRIRAEHTGSAPVQVALFGGDPSAFGNHPATESGAVVLSAGAARELSASAGDTVVLAGHEFRVADVSTDDWYSHTPVIWTSLADWQAASPRSGAATVLAVTGSLDHGGLDPEAGTQTVAAGEAVGAIGSYQAENSSLTLMTMLLFAISALVIGAFFTVWTVQRQPDVATLKALGATTGSLVLDALAQAAIVLVTGVTLGLGITAAASLALGDAVPFVLSPATTLVPALALIVLGLAGAAVALRFLFTTDPLTALGATR